MDVVSLGAGVQSSGIIIMMEEGLLPKADLVVFADTGDEPRRVYEYLEYLKSIMTMPFVQVMKGDGLKAAIEAACRGELKRVSTLPLFTGGGGRIKRQCTWDYKVMPIRREIKQHTKKATVIRGISFDERHRATQSDVKWIKNAHPLVDRQMTRQDIARLILKLGHPMPPKSACRICSNRCNAGWLEMRGLAPDDFEAACRMDELMRNNLPKMKEEVFIHRQCVPLRDADFEKGIDPDQLALGGDGWADCEGLCGV